MIGSDSAGILPPFHKSPQISSSIAPFRSSLNKNPSYFSLVRSPDVLQEKKKLKEENWRLKQLLHSLNEENLKLKQKVAQKTEPRLSMADGSQFLNQSKYIDILQDSLRTLRNELNKKKQENLELRKKLFKDDKPIDVIKVKFSRGSFHSSDSNNDRELQEKLKSELTRNVTYLQSEVRILQEEKVSMFAELSGLRCQVLAYQAKPELVVQVLDSLSTEGEKERDKIVLQLPKRLNSSLSIRLEGDRILKRENLKGDQANVNRFFRNFFMELSSNNLELDHVINFLKRSPREMDLELFIEVLNYYRIRVNPVEIEQTFNFICEGELVSKDEFIRTLKNYSYEFDSSKSSDISSDISSGSATPTMMKITITKQVESGVSTVFDNISLRLREQGISKSEVIKKCEENLSSSINFSSLLSFFTENETLISDPHDRTFVTVNFMEGFELKSRKEIIEKCIENFFRFPEDYSMNTYKIESVLDKIHSKKSEFIEKCKEYDNLQVESLSWEVLNEVLKKLELITEDSILDFKYHCFFLNKNLKQIPYLMLTHEDEVKKEKPREIKTFFRMKSVNKP